MNWIWIECAYRQILRGGLILTLWYRKFISDSRFPVLASRNQPNIAKSERRGLNQLIIAKSERRGLIQLFYLVTPLCSQRGAITFPESVSKKTIFDFFRRLVLDAQEELDNKFGI